MFGDSLASDQRCVVRSWVNRKTTQVFLEVHFLNLGRCSPCSRILGHVGLVVYDLYTTRASCIRFVYN